MSREDVRRRHHDFLDRVKREFAYLVSDFGYGEPDATESDAPLFRDTVVYANPAARRKIEILNAYHPYDYGYEINVHDLQSGKTVMVDHVLRDDQDSALDFVARTAKRLRERARAQLAGAAWFTERA